MYTFRRRMFVFLLMAGTHFLTSFPMLLFSVVLCMHENATVWFLLPTLWFFPLHLADLAGFIDDETVSVSTFSPLAFGLGINSFVWTVIVYGLWLLARRVYAWWKPEPIPKADTRVETLLRDWVRVPANRGES